MATIKIAANIILILMISSCWLKENDDNLLVPEISYLNGKPVFLDSFLIHSIEIERGSVQLNDKILVMDGYVKPINAGSLYDSFGTVVQVGDYIKIDSRANRLFVRKRNGEVFQFWKKTRRDYKSYEDWW